jgi:hypothetical protein
MSQPRRAPPLSVAPTVPMHQPDLLPEHKAAIMVALRWAWLELRSRDPGLLHTGDEESITERVQALLNERRGGRRVATWLNDFETVTRGESQRTAAGKVGRKPDLTFRPLPYSSVTSMSRWGWFVECKIIDGDASVTAYRDAGVARFSSGAYAAWMPSAAMLAYVRDDSTPAHALHQVLPGHVGTKRHSPGPASDRSESEHDRSHLPIPCVDVALTHFWLSATIPAQLSLGFDV